MKLSIITEDGLTAYTDTIAPIVTEDAVAEDFADVLDDATNTIKNQVSSGTKNTISADSPLQAIFEEASQTYGVDINLLKAIAKQESNFQTDATSSSGAQGIMQLMPATAEGLGVTDAYDPYQNIMGGARLISKLLGQYNGDVTLALAAYNAGSGNVAKYGGVPPFEETQNYVVKVQGYYEEGVDVPDITVSDGTQTKEEIAEQLSQMLADLPKHPSYDVLLEQMKDMTGYEATEDRQDTYAAYQVLRNTNRAIREMLSNNAG